jgi:hypothetical protein
MSVAKVSTPVAMPVTGSMVSMVISALVHVPPDGELVYSVELKLQNALLPTIGDGSGLTVDTTVLEQPVTGSVYIMLAVPNVRPDTRPDELTGATAGLLLLHVPPVLVVASNEVKPIHTPGLPVIVAGCALITMFVVRTQPIPTV